MTAPEKKNTHIDLTSDNKKVQVDEKSEQTKVPTRKRSQSCNRHEGQNVEHQKPRQSLVVKNA